MGDARTFAWLIGLLATAILLAVLANRVSDRIRVPAPALFLVAAAIGSDLFPELGRLSPQINQRIVTVALIFVLFDGGMHIGWKRFRTSAGAVVWIGVAGTIVTAGALAVTAHLVLGFSWTTAMLIGAALSPTDPAVVFSVLGQREIQGRSGTILEGESGANDPVGIALMAVLLGTTGGGITAVATGLGEFALQMVVGAAVGVAGGLGLARLMRIPLPNEALYSIRLAAAAVVVYAAATLLFGSGFLAVLVAGILIGDVRAPFKREVERFTSGLSGLGEIVAFTVLGLSISVRDAIRPDVFWAGLAIAAILILVIRPILVGAVTARIKLDRGERAFVLWAGLKGAVPILLGTYVLGVGRADARRVYEIIFVVVLISVVVQGGLVPTFARLLSVPMTTAEPQPFALGLRFTGEPDGVYRCVVAPGARAEGSTVADLNIGDDAWINMIRRDGQLVQIRGNTVLQAGDEVLVQTDPDVDLQDLFRSPPSTGG
ncbi:cation:proton antiporter [Nakamurella sp. PAMC28650]|uniref:cation:proton antiporter domain-containing protein n=1 Tax=Nakamurella sp. PAMC28650 TaxID=2762325 RepID=UPI00164E931F|nr:cation:proton antiporter [Nakamurella sp. PAMC28650]QNK81581.1 cation:proton antiporter [Nakamurella sp. PAMC28650]